jgi:hypothetical protein
MAPLEGAEFGHPHEADEVATAGQFGRELRHRFPKATYNQRWYAESGFGEYKRHLGPVLIICNDPSQLGEFVIRALTDDFMSLADAA